MNDQPDTPTSQSTAARWTFYRRLGLLLRTRLDSDGATPSLHDVAARTRGRVSADQLIALLEQGAQAQPDAVTCVVLAQAFDVDPDYFMDETTVADYIQSVRAAYQDVTGGTPNVPISLQAQALAVVAAGNREALLASVR